MLHLSSDAHFGADCSIVWWHAPSLWSITLAHNLISGLFRPKPYTLTWSILRRNVSLARSPIRLLITSRGIQQPSGSSLHTTQSHKPPIFPLSTYILVEHLPPPHYVQRLDWVRGHDMPRLRHPTLTCSTVDTSGPSCYIRVRACATPTCISTQTRAACRGAALAALRCKAPCSHVTSLLRRSLWCTL